MNERLREALRRKIAAHNRLVALTSVCGVIAVAIMWTGIYFTARWAAVLSATVVKGVEAAMPRHFDRAFATFAVALLAAGWVARRLGLYQHVREEKGAGLVMLELCLLPARATLGTLGNFQNHIALGEDDLRLAADFLTRVVRAGKLAATAVPVELPDEAARRRVLLALQLLDLIYLRKGKPSDFYAVADPQSLVRFLSGSAPVTSVS